MSNSKVVPLFDKILVKVSAAEEETKGGLIIADSAKEKQSQGVVLDVGKDCKCQSLRGTIVIFPKYVGTEIKSDDPSEELLIIKEEDLLAYLMQ